MKLSPFLLFISVLLLCAAGLSAFSDDIAWKEAALAFFAAAAYVGSALSKEIRPS